jgi:hypothetical protein
MSLIVLGWAALETFYYNNNNMSKDTSATGNIGNLTEKFLQVISEE